MHHRSQQQAGLTAALHPPSTTPRPSPTAPSTGRHTSSPSPPRHNVRMATGGGGLTPHESVYSSYLPSHRHPSPRDTTPREVLPTPRSHHRQTPQVPAALSEPLDLYEARQRLATIQAMRQRISRAVA